MGLNIQLATSRLKSKRQEARKGKKTECPSRYLTCDIEVFSKDRWKWSLLTPGPLRELDGEIVRYN